MASEDQASRILEAASFAAARFLTATDWQHSVQEFLRRLGEATGASRVYIFENHSGEGGLRCSQRFEWCRPGIKPQIDNSALQDLAYDLGFDRWAEVLGRGEEIGGRLYELPAAEQGFLREQDIRSIVAVPILVTEQWWGFIGFDDCLSDRVWTTAEISSLKLASAIFGAAVHNRNMAEALRSSEELYRGLFEGANDFVYLQDLEGRFTSVNRLGAALTGYRPEELLGMSGYDLIVPEHHERAREMTRRKLAGEETMTSYQLDVMTKQGRRIVVDLNTRLVREDGKVVGVQGIARDITERKRLDEQQLQSQKMEAIGRLAGGVAHDFNNLLTVINGHASRISKSLGLDSPLGNELRDILHAGEQAADLTRQLLAFSRQQVMVPRVLEINAVVDRMEGMLRRLIGEHIELKRSLQEDLGRVRADPGQLEQVILNLVVNARDAMPGGGCLELVTGETVLEKPPAGSGSEIVPGPYVVVEVRDTGSGMDSKTLSKVFEPFFTTKEIGKGTGLGLSTVLGIVEQCGGSILAESHPEKGSVFKVLLPKVEDDLPAGPAPEPTAVTGTGTVLLVEDEDMVRELTRMILEDGGYEVLEAPDGARALEISESYPGAIDLLLTDVVMPGLSGPQLARELTSRRSRTRVILMSGYTEKDVAEHGAVDGETTFLQKPFPPDDLLRLVRESLDLRHRSCWHKSC